MCLERLNSFLYAGGRLAETYDLLVRPAEDRAFTVFAESLDLSGYTRETLAPEAGLQARVPALRPRPDPTPR